MLRRRKWYEPRAIAGSFLLRPRLWISALAGLAVYALAGHLGNSSLREGIAWSIGGLVYIVTIAYTVFRATPETIARRAEREDESAMVIMAIVLIAIASSFASIFGLLAEAKTAPAGLKTLSLLLAGAVIIVAWSVMQLAFMLHYAHEHYRARRREPAHPPPLNFPATDKPDYWDFLYFATTIGAASQTSDVDVQSRAMRRVVTIHSVLSFFFNTTILALTINLAAGLVQG